MKTECIGDHVKLKGKVYPCTVSLTMDLVGGKWKAVILYHLKDLPETCLFSIRNKTSLVLD